MPILIVIVAVVAWFFWPGSDEWREFFYPNRNNLTVHIETGTSHAVRLTMNAGSMADLVLVASTFAKRQNASATGFQKCANGGGPGKGFCAQSVSIHRKQTQRFVAQNETQHRFLRSRSGENCP